MMKFHLAKLLPSTRKLLFLSFILVICGCNLEQRRDADAIKQTIRRYNQLMILGYRTLNMNQIQEVTTQEVALKAYHHMAALGEGRLRMDASLKNLAFGEVTFSSSGQASATTTETWDFTHFDMATGKKFAEEKDFVYEMAYSLKKAGSGSWIIDRIDAVKGSSTNSVIPWPDIDRNGVRKAPGAAKAH